MKISSAGIWCLLLIFILTAGPAAPVGRRGDQFVSRQAPWNVPYADDFDNEVLVKFKPTVTASQTVKVLGFFGAASKRTIPQLGVHTIEAGPTTPVADLVELLRRDPRVEYAEPNRRLYLAAAPNDTYFKYQYALANTGQMIAPAKYDLPRGTAGADIRAVSGWEVATGNKAVLVGVVDTGVDLTHPDLAPNIYSPGRDFANDDFDATDDHGHGTHVAGIIGARGNDGYGVSGLCWSCRILPVKVFNSGAGGKTDWVVNGIVWAADHGARVINMSLGGPDVSVGPTLENGIRYAYEKNAVLVAAAGNDGVRGVWYPAAYDDYVLAVSATDHNDDFVTLQSSGGIFGSNWGPQVDVAAPGLYVLSTWGMTLWGRGRPGWTGYNYNWGTSMSTAFVSGLAALLVSYQPWLTNRDVMDIIRWSASDLNRKTNPGWDEKLGYGRISVARALALARQMDAFTPRLWKKKYPEAFLR